MCAFSAFSQIDIIPQEGFETDKLGTLYQANFFANATSADWYRRGNLTSGTNNFLPFTPTGITGMYIGADDVDEAGTGENPLGDGEFAYLTFKTINVSAYSEIDVTLKIGAHALGQFSNTPEESRPDTFEIQVAYDGNIATGANGLDALPTVANLNSGTYTTGGQFSALGNQTNLALDTNFDDTGDGTILGNNAQEFTFKIPTNGATLASVRIRIGMDQGGEDIFYDDVKIQGNTTLSTDKFSFESSINLSPNPLNKDRVLNISNNSQNTITSIEVYDVIGKKVFTEATTTESIQFPNTIPSGMYFVKITDTKNNSITKKIMVQ